MTKGSKDDRNRIYTEHPALFEDPKACCIGLGAVNGKRSCLGIVSKRGSTDDGSISWVWTGKYK